MTRYENAQAPFLHNSFPAPALTITVLLASDPRLNSIHAFHRARTLKASSSDLATHMDKLEVDLEHKQSLVAALEDKSDTCKHTGDEMGAKFWGERVSDKQKEVNAIEGELFACQAEYATIIEQLFDDSQAYPGLSLQTFADTEEREEVARTEQTLDELAAWKAGNDLAANGNGNERMSFPPLDHVLQSQGLPPHRRSGRCGGPRGGPLRFNHPFGPPAHITRQWGPPHRGHHAHSSRGPSPPTAGPPKGLRNLFEKVNDVHTAAAAISPAQEIKSMLDGFLANLTNQLAGTFEGSPRVSEPGQSSSSTSAPATAPQVAVCPPAPPHYMPGGYEPVINPASDSQAQSPSFNSTAKSTTPSSKLGKGGFRHKHVSCDGCLHGIRGVRYKCEVSLCPVLCVDAYLTTLVIC